MGVSCLNPFVDLIERVRSWVSFMSGVYCDCRSLIPGPTSGHRCRNCGRLFCGKCMHVGLDQPKLCKSCYQGITSNLRVTHLEDLSNLSSPRSSRSGDDEDGDDSGKQFFNLQSESSQNIPDVDSVSLSSRLKSVNSSPVDSPCRSGEVVDHEDLLESSSHCSVFDNLSMYRNHENKKVQQPLDFENNRLIWDPPLPEDENDDVETGFVGYDDEDDDIGVSSNVFSSSSFGSNSFSMRERPCDAQKEQLRSAVRGHFRALVSQLLKGEGLEIGSDSGGIGWLDIVSSLAWQAATFVKPDTSKGSSMDPGSYVKVKCVLSGSPSNSTLIKGVVCTKNVKHKRMITQHRTPKIFLLGGALEYLRVSNKLASINTVLKQENDHLKVCISKIEVHRPNVLLVEKSASPYAQEYLLTKEISLVLNVKRTLLERIARCTGATIAPSLDNIGSARVGHCEMFRVEKFSEESSSGNNPNRKTIKALMFFDGCPRRSGCTVLLRGKHREELKKVKHVVQYASFAAYHLSRETSFLADEGASLPKTPSNPSFLSTSAAHNANQIVAGDHRRHSSCSNDSTISLFQCANVLSLEMDNSQLSGEEAREPSDYHVNASVPEEIMIDTPEERRILEIHEEVGEVNENEASEYYSADSHSILVSVSTSCVLKETLCEPSQLIRIKFYGSFDKPLGRYLRDDLFDQTSYCGTCKEPAEAHVRCYTHQHGSLTVSVRRHPLMTLPGERDGRIWMWHRCLMCEQSDGVPPAARRVVMSDAAWGLSFGKFLELCFSNHATANRVASCGHSLQKDCLHFYGCGNMVAFFRYSPVDILSVHLPPLVLDFASQLQQEWAKKEAADFLGKIEFLHLEVTKVLRGIEQKITTSEHEPVKTSIHKYILDLKELLNRERNDYDALLQPDESSPFQGMIDVLELNRLRQCLLIDSQTWERRLCLLDSFSKSNSTTMLHPQISQFASLSNLKEWQVEQIKHHEELNFHTLESNLNSMVEMDLSIASIEGYGDISGLNLVSSVSFREHDENISLERVPSAASNLSDKIDSLWSGNPGADGVGSISMMDNPLYRKVVSPLRVNSFDSALKFRDRLRGPSSLLHLTSLRSFDASGDSSSLDYLQKSPTSMKRLNLAPSPYPVFISSASHMVGDGARLLLHPGHDDLVIVLYENEPSTIISCAISSKDHSDFVSLNHKFNDEAIGRPSISQCQSDDELQRILLNYMLDFKDPHFKFSFDDESLIPSDKVKFSVTCYFANQFYGLRKMCCPNEADFLRSLSRCKKWNAQGGKSNVYFAKSFDERFIIKQVTKTELDSFEVFAPEYFKYMTESINSGSPTCLAKVLGIFQVTVRHLKGGREVKMDLMIMENLFFGRTLSKIYDLKGSCRARYNPDTSGNNNVLLDLNLLESLRTKPIFLGSRAKRRLDRAVWNDTSFLATIDVMDYSLLVGIDDERKELVIGIIDFMRQYTWDKHLETWVKASGILGGPKNASPTVISPLQYKKRFRKAMSKYFLTVPDQWSSL